MRAAVLVFVVASSLFGACGAKDSEKKPQEAPKVEEPAAPRSPKPDDPPKPAAAPPAAGSGGDACKEYREVVEKLAACSGDAIPKATREAITANFARDWTSWDKLDGSDKARREDVCRSAVESIKLAAAEACGW